MRIIVIIIIILLAACHAPIKYPSGGYDYPNHIPANDTNYYYFPVRNKFSRRDSLRASWEYVTYHTLDEPNLSLKPMFADVFRFFYSEALNPAPIIITITPDTITIKTAKLTDYFDQYLDSNALSPQQRLLAKLLDKYYPLDDTTHRSIHRRRYLDSLGALHPQLYNPAYYDTLVRKQLRNAKPMFTYTTKNIRITHSDFQRIIAEINNSGYWQLPPQLPCQSPPFDGDGYHLEANTPKKYNYVSAGSCDDSINIAFAKACQQIVNLAGMKKRIHIYFDPTTDTIKKSPLVIQNVQLEDVKPQPRKHKHHKAANRK